MKKASLILAALCMAVMLSVTAFAEKPVIPDIPLLPESSSQSEQAQSESSALSEDIPIATTPDEGDAATFDDAAPTMPELKKTNNTPLFIVAGISLVGFAGVAVFCKRNGRNK